MVMLAETGSKSATYNDNNCGLVSNLLVRKEAEMRERRKLEMPETNISWEEEMFFLLHLAPKTFATAIAAAVYTQSPTPT